MRQTVDVKLNQTVDITTEYLLTQLHYGWSNDYVHILEMD